MDSLKAKWERGTMVKLKCGCPNSKCEYITERKMENLDVTLGESIIKGNVQVSTDNKGKVTRSAELDMEMNWIHSVPDSEGSNLKKRRWDIQACFRKHWEECHKEVDLPLALCRSVHPGQGLPWDELSKLIKFPGQAQTLKRKCTNLEVDGKTVIELMKKKKEEEQGKKESANRQSLVNSMHQILRPHQHKFF